jgi:hypothetical protein
MTDILYKIRAKVAPRLNGGIRFVGLAIVALGALLVVEGEIIVGSVILVTSVPITWLTGAWVVPRSSDSYFVKIANLVTDAHLNYEYDSDRQRKGLERIAGEITNTTAPQSWLGIHRKIVVDMGQIDKGLTDLSVSFTDRAVSGFESVQSLRRVRRELDDRPDDSYAREMARLLDRYKAAASVRTRKKIQALHRFQARVNGLTPPSQLTERHEKYRELLGEYISAMDAYCMVVENDEPGAVERAATTIEATYTSLKIEGRKYFDELQSRTRLSCAFAI